MKVLNRDHEDACNYLYLDTELRFASIFLPVFPLPSSHMINTTKTLLSQKINRIDMKIYNRGRTEQKHVRSGQSLQHIVIGYITCLTIFEILGEAGQKSGGMEILGR